MDGLVMTQRIFFPTLLFFSLPNFLAYLATRPGTTYTASRTDTDDGREEGEKWERAKKVQTTNNPQKEMIVV
jgi:hypothetical protein